MSAAECTKKAHCTGAKFVVVVDAFYPPAKHYSMIIWPFVSLLDLKQMGKLSNFTSPICSTDEYIKALHAFCECHPMILIHLLQTLGIKESISEVLKPPFLQGEKLSSKTGVQIHARHDLGFKDKE